MPEKKCCRCKVVKSLDEFHKDKSGEDGMCPLCKECQKERDRQYYQDNREKILERHKQYGQDNREKKKEYSRQYYQANKEKKREYANDKYNNDPTYALRSNVSRLILRALHRNNGSKQGESVLQYLPYTIEQLKEHLESQFVEGMSWENRTEWHLDHIKPQSLLPYDSMAHPNFQECWALENLQPLWAVDNMSKGNKFEEAIQ